MSTITTKIQVTKTDKRFSQRLLSTVCNVESNRYKRDYLTIAPGAGPVEHEFTELCIVNFAFPTLIQIVIEGVASPEISASGSLVLPFAGKLIVSHPGGGLTSPVEYDIFTS